jgi:hypothetical protein
MKKECQKNRIQKDRTTWPRPHPTLKVWWFSEGQDTASRRVQ